MVVHPYNSTLSKDHHASLQMCSSSTVLAQSSNPSKDHDASLQTCRSRTWYHTGKALWPLHGWLFIQSSNPSEDHDASLQMCSSRIWYHTGKGLGHFTGGCSSAVRHSLRSTMPLYRQAAPVPFLHSLMVSELGGKEKLCNTAPSLSRWHFGTKPKGKHQP